MVSSCPSNVFKYCICCGEGTGIKLGSLFANVVFAVEDGTDVGMFLCCARSRILYNPSEIIKNIHHFNLFNNFKIIIMYKRISLKMFLIKDFKNCLSSN